MKTRQLLKKSATISICTIVLLLFSSASNAQLKLYSNGSLSIGSITQPPAGDELQVVGNSLFSNNTGIIASSAYIKGANMFSSASNPDYSWWGDTLSGVFHPGLNTMAFAIGGRTTMLLSPGNNIIIDSTFDNGDRLQVNGGLNRSPFDIFSNTTSNNIYSGINWVSNSTTKAWAVKNGTSDEFYVYGNGQAYSYGWNTISDSTLKENVMNINGALGKVLRLQGVTYNLKHDAKELSGNRHNIRQMGLIAQAVQRVVPEVVTTNDNGIETIAYSNMVGLLVEAIKQEDVKVNMLQHKLDSCIALNKQTGSVNKPNGVGNEAKLYPCASCSVNHNATFQCYIPEQSKNASLMVFDMSGALKKTIPITGKDTQYVSVNSGELNAGMYYYSLLVDGTEIDTHKIIMTQD
jgi:hypothetical protein